MKTLLSLASFGLGAIKEFFHADSSKLLKTRTFDALTLAPGMPRPWQNSGVLIAANLSMIFGMAQENEHLSADANAH